MKHLHMFLGNKRDQLVAKFIAILKAKVEEKKKDALMRNNERFVRQIMQRKSFIKGFK